MWGETAVSPSLAVAGVPPRHSYSSASRRIPHSHSHCKNQIAPPQQTSYNPLILYQGKPIVETYKIQEGAAIYYLTFTVVEWLPVFIAEEPCLIVTDSLNFCHHHKSLRVNAFVIMPTHAHLILFDADYNVARLRKTVNDMRQFTGRRLADYCEQRMPDVYRDVIDHSRRVDRMRQFWQPSRHPIGILTAAFWQTKIAYIHDNPRRKGLVREGVAWRFSSAGYWLSDPPGESDVILTGIEW